MENEGRILNVSFCFVRFILQGYNLLLSQIQYSVVGSRAGTIFLLTTDNATLVYYCTYSGKAEFHLLIQGDSKKTAAT